MKSSEKNKEGEIMKLGLNHLQTQQQTKKRKSKKARYKNCRLCGSDNLLSVGVDQFCCQCDWHTCFEYVDKGYMNNLQLAHYDHFSTKKVNEEKIPILPKGNAPIIPDTSNQDPKDKKTAS